MADSRSTLSDRDMATELRARDARNTLTGGAKQTRIKLRFKVLLTPKARNKAKASALLLVLCMGCALQGCYLSHGLSDPQTYTGGGAGDGDPFGDDGMGTVLADGGMDTDPGAEDAVNTLVPVLYEVTPREGCTNTDQWLALSGARIDHRSSITITYVFSGATAEIPRGSAAIDWRDLSETAFRTQVDLPWVPAQVNPDAWPSGNYLIHVTNPNGNVSNSVGIDLQFCAP